MAARVCDVFFNIMCCQLLIKQSRLPPAPVMCDVVRQYDSLITNESVPCNVIYQSRVLVFV